MEIISIINHHHVKKDPIPPDELPEPPPEPDPPLELPLPLPEVPEAYADLTPLHF
jgi:hypothetical protein